MATPRFNECNGADDETLKIRTLVVESRGRRNTAGIPYTEGMYFVLKTSLVLVVLTYTHIISYLK